MKRIIDLTHPISEGMPVFPGDPEVSFTQVHAIKEGGYNVTRMSMSSHTGTHVDSPHHCIHSDRTVDRMPLEYFVGWAEVIDLTANKPGGDITAADLDPYAGRVGDGARVLIRTDWSKRIREPDYFTKHPGLTEGAAMWLTARKIKLLGIEQPNVHLTQHQEIHKALLSTGMVLIESLANLDQLTCDRVYLVALPLAVVNLDGSPTRVIAIEGEF